MDPLATAAQGAPRHRPAPVLSAERCFYVFRLTYLGGFSEPVPPDSVWFRELRVHSALTLEELHDVILTVLGWDRMHLYIFKSREQIYAGLGEPDALVIDDQLFREPFFSTAVCIRDLDLGVGSTVEYEYDFGDQQLFSLQVLNIDRSESNSSHPVILALQGGTIEQYPEQSHPTIRTTESLLVPGEPIRGCASPMGARWRVRFIRHSDKAVLEEWRRSKDKRLWERAVAILENRRLLPEAVAEKVERPLPRVREWIQIYNWQGPVGLRHRRKPRSDKSDHQTDKRIQRLIEIIHHQPFDYGVNRSSWSLTAIADVYQRQHGDRIGRSTTGRLIKQAGYSIKKARKVLTSPDPDYREKVEVLLQTLNSLMADEVFFFVDELGPVPVKKYGGRAYTHRTGSASYLQQLIAPSAV